MEEVINAISREMQGKGASRRLRHDKKVPAIIYGGKKKPQNISLNFYEINHLLEFNEDVYSSVLDLSIDGKKAEQVILKDMQRHPAKNVVTHLDFQRVSATTKITTSVPVMLIGDSENQAIRLGAVINKFIDMVEVQCLPKDLPHSIELDITDMKIGDSVSLSGLEVSKEVIITALNHDDDAHDQTVVSLSAPKIMAKDADEEETTDAPEDEQGSDEDSESQDKE